MLLEDFRLKAENWLPGASIQELQKAMETGETTAVELVLLYMWRIGSYDRQGPKLNSVLEVNPDALQIAEGLDRERKLRGPRGPLHGIPILLKDNLDTGDKMHTSAGSLALADSYAPEDSTVAARLREAGAILLGKTNMTEWANFMSDRMPTGYSSRGGQTLNPYGPGRFIVGGSSAGSGAAATAAFAAAAIGTETSGSILNPASHNSLVGVKPTVGLVSRHGIIPIAHSQDTAGPMARCVHDAALLLGAIAGEDAKDAATAWSEGREPLDYTKGLSKEALRGARIGIVRGFFQELEKPERWVMEQALEDLRQAGAVLVDPVVLDCEEEQWSFDVLSYEFYGDLNHYLSRLHSEVPVRTLAELISYNRRNADRMLKYGQARMLHAEQLGGRLTELAYAEGRAQDLYLSRDRGIDGALKKHELQALLFPGSNGCHIAAKAGYPSVTVPAGYSEQGPIGLTFTGTAFSEARLLQLAYAYEQTGGRRVPPDLNSKEKKGLA